jgi:hypothetical protein
VRVSGVRMGHKDIELAAHDLLQYLDGTAGITPSG